MKKQLYLFDAAMPVQTVPRVTMRAKGKTRALAVETTPEARRLLDSFEVLAEAPGGVKKLRELILDLAMRGKLVSQDPAEGTAVTLVTQLAHAKIAISSKWSVKANAPLSPVEDSDAPYTVPASWRWARLGDFGVFLGGGTPSKSNPSFWAGPIPWVSPKDMKRPYIDDAEDHISDAAVTNSAVKLIPTGALLFVVRGMILAHSFPTALTTREVTVNQDMKALVLALPALGEYLLRACQGARQRMLERVERSSHGTCRLDSEDVGQFPIPLPPLAEQKRIVAKVDELMKLCDDLEARQTKQRETAGRLNKAALDALTSAEGPEELAASWRRVAGSFDALLNRPESVEELRASVLELAVRGRLVSQDFHNESANDLLFKILAKRSQYVGAQAIPQQPPHGLPTLANGWCWASLDALLIHLRNGISQAPVGDSGVPILRISAVRPNHVNINDTRFLPGTLSDYAGFEISEGDLLFTRYSGNAHYVGICGVVPKLSQSTVHPDKLIRGIACPGLLEPRFLALAVNVGESRRRVDECARTTAGQIGISGKQLKGIPIPLAPLAEQKRIVAKVDELMKLCDALEDALRRAEDTAKNLADALVAELLA